MIAYGRIKNHGAGWRDWPDKYKRRTMRKRFDAAAPMLVTSWIMASKKKRTSRPKAKRSSRSSRRHGEVRSKPRDTLTRFCGC